MVSLFVGISVINRIECAFCVFPIFYFIYPKIKDQLLLSAGTIMSLPIIILLINGEMNYKTFNIFKLTSFHGGVVLFSGNNDNLDGSHHSFEKYMDVYIPKQKIADLNEALQATSATLGQVADLFGRESKAGKAAAIAQATIDTYLSAQKAYTSTVGIPIVGPVLAPINAGLAIAAGIKNIKAITAVKTPGGGGGGGGNISNSFTSGAQAPKFNVVGDSGMNQLAQIQQTPVQAYVVSGEVTSAQALDRNRIKNATL